MSNEELSIPERKPTLERHRIRSEMLKRMLLVLMGLWLLATLSMTAYNSVLNRSQNARLIECTTPGYKCYQDTNKRTANAVGLIIEQGVLEEVATRRVVLMVEHCASLDTVQTISQLEKCVRDGLEVDDDDDPFGSR